MLGIVYIGCAREQDRRPGQVPKSSCTATDFLSCSVPATHRIPNE